LDTSKNNTSPKGELEKRRVLTPQYSLRLLTIKVVFFGICFGIIRNYIYPEFILPLSNCDVLLCSAWVCVLGNMVAFYFGLLFGQNNIAERPLKWCRSDRLPIAMLIAATAILSWSFILIIQVVAF
jgi:hypothetical protein